MVSENASKTSRILDLIAQSGENGMRFTDIQRALWDMSHPGVPFTRNVRGYWCTNLTGGRFYHDGILNTFCEKGQDGRWRTKRVHGRHPWKDVYGTAPKGSVRQAW